MSELFKNIPLTVTEIKPDGYKNKIQILFKCIGGKWYIKKLGYKPSPIKGPRLGNTTQEKEGNTLKKLK